MTVEYAEPAGETHGSMIGATMPLVFERLAKHSKADWTRRRRKRRLVGRGPIAAWRK